MLRARLVRAERRLNITVAFLLVFMIVPWLLGAFATSDEIVLRDGATGRVRILLKAHPDGPAFIQINSADGNRRIHVGESPTGIPNMAIYQPDGMIEARVLAP